MAKEGIQVIERKGGKRYKAYVDAPTNGGKRNQITKTFATEADAVKWRVDRLHEIHSGGWVDETDYLLREVFELYVQARITAGRIGDNTIAGQRSAMQCQFGPLLDKPVKEIKPIMIEGCLARERKRGVSGATLNKSFTILRSCLRWVVNEQEWLARNPTDKVMIPEIDTEEKQGWSHEEIQRFLISTAESREFPLWATMLGAGLRRGECQALLWEDVNFEEHVLRVVVSTTLAIGEDGHAHKVMGSRPKTKKSKRIVPLHGDVEEILKRHKVAMKREALLLGIGFDEGRHVFSDDTGLTFLSDKTIDSRFKNAIRKSKVRRLTPHELRHTFGSRMVGNGVPLPLVMKWMGHSKLETAKRYQHPNQAEEVREMKRLTDAFRLMPEEDEDEGMATAGTRR